MHGHGRVPPTTKALDSMVGRLKEINSYLDSVSNGGIPLNNQIIYNLQNIFNLLPNLNVDSLIKALLYKTNDIYHAIYISSLVRSVIALHKLLNNKIKYSDMNDVLDRSAGLSSEHDTKIVKSTTDKASDSNSSK